MSERGRLISVFLLLWLVTGGALVFYGSRIDGNTYELRVAQLRACHRLNLIRAEDNRSQLQDFRLFTATALLISKAAPPRRLSRSRAREGVTYLREIRADVLGKEWTPLTQCRPAVEDPGRYVAPLPIPFAFRLPSAAALVVRDGE